MTGDFHPPMAAINVLYQVAEEKLHRHRQVKINILMFHFEPIGVGNTVSTDPAKVRGVVYWIISLNHPL